MATSTTITLVWSVAAAGLDPATGDHVVQLAGADAGGRVHLLRNFRVKADGSAVLDVDNAGVPVAGLTLAQLTAAGATVTAYNAGAANLGTLLASLGKL